MEVGNRDKVLIFGFDDIQGHVIAVIGLAQGSRIGEPGSTSEVPALAQITLDPIKFDKWLVGVASWWERVKREKLNGLDVDRD